MLKPVLIIGGTGVFGKRLVRHLAKFEGIELFVSSRNAAKALAFIKTLPNCVAPLHAVSLNCAENLDTRLTEILPFIVVDCSGPFQGAGYDTASCVLRNGAHFIDLADARDYLANFSDALDELACEKGVTALAGASSTPTLSTCVTDSLTAGWRRVDTIDICITPGGRSEVGRSVIEAILSYAGRSIPIWSAGQLTQTTGWGDARTVDIPGLGRRRVAAVETYDAEHLGPRLNVHSRVSFAAGLESKIEQWGIETLSALKKRGLVGRLSSLIPVLLRARKLTRIPTSDTGGMVVDVCGINERGTCCHARWSLLAKKDHGPFVPILPAAAAIKKLLRGCVAPGARLAHTSVTLEDICEQMIPYDITTETSETKTDRSVFEMALGDTRYKSLPSALTAFHDHSGPLVWSGKSEIVGAQWFVPRLLATIFGFPKTSQDADVKVVIDRAILPCGTPFERWTRSFSGKRMSSILKVDHKGELSEQFEPFTFDLPVEAKNDGLRMPVSGWRLGKWKLPKIFAPISDAREFMDDQGRFRFDVRLSAPLIGLIVHYKGWLQPNTQRER